MDRIYPYTFFIVSHLAYDYLVKYWDNKLGLASLFFGSLYLTFAWLMAIEMKSNKKSAKYVFIGYFIVFSFRLVLNLLGTIGNDWGRFNSFVNNIYLDLIGWLVLFGILLIWLLSKRGIST